MTGFLEKSDYTIYYGSHFVIYVLGLGLLASRYINLKLSALKTVERPYTLCMQDKFSNICLINTHVHIKMASESEKDFFYEGMERTLCMTSK